MRKLIAIALLVSQMWIIGGGIFSALVNIYVQHQAKVSLNEKLSQLPSRTNLLSSLNEIALQHEKDKQSKSLPEAWVTSNIVFACVDEGSSLIKIFCSAKIDFCLFKTWDTLEGFHGLVVPPPKFV